MFEGAYTCVLSVKECSQEFSMIIAYFKRII